MSRNQRVVNNHENMVKDYSRKRWLILSLLSVEIDMFVTWLCPLDLENREIVASQVGKEAAKQGLTPEKAGEIAAKAVKDAGGNNLEAAKAAAVGKEEVAKEAKSHLYGAVGKLQQQSEAQQEVSSAREQQLEEQDATMKDVSNIARLE